MSAEDILGLAAAASVFLTFYTVDPVRGRRIAILSNVLFMAYAALETLPPIFVLHSILLPLNVMRLDQLTAAGGGGRRSFLEDFEALTQLPQIMPTRSRVRAQVRARHCADAERRADAERSEAARSSAQGTRVPHGPRPPS